MTANNAWSGPENLIRHCEHLHPTVEEVRMAASVGR